MSFWSKAIPRPLPTVLKLELGDIAAGVVFKDIKNLHLRVGPPAGEVRISAPLRMTPETIRAFALSKLDWIRRQQLKLRRPERETPREYRDSESHYVWGKPYLLKLIAVDQAPSIDLTHDQMLLRLRPETPARKKQAIMEEWYRARVAEALPPLIAKWEMAMVVKVERFFVRRMKTRWGSCIPRTHRIRLNAELARKSPELLEYVVVHEMVHLIERHHNNRFVDLMDQHLPNWRDLRKALNNAPPTASIASGGQPPCSSIHCD
jgi:predicted metal-dependent hydrolase